MTNDEMSYQYSRENNINLCRVSNVAQKIIWEDNRKKWIKEINFKKNIMDETVTHILLPINIYIDIKSISSTNGSHSEMVNWMDIYPICDMYPSNIHTTRLYIYIYIYQSYYKILISNIQIVIWNIILIRYHIT